FNYLTKSEVVAKDLLFATLDPTMRAVVLRSGQRIILSDTVGFISDLPTQLVTAFRATLEEVLEADLIVHVRDAAHADSEPQRLDVIGVLKEIGIDEHDERPVIEALNKIDLLDEEERSALQMSVRLSKERTICTIEEPARIAISAVTGEGLGELQDLIDRLVTAERETFVIETPASNGAARAFLHEAGDVRSEETEGERTRFTVRLTRKSFGQFRKAFPDAVIVSPGEEVRRLA
ncbi:MAG TPA: 50S ribosome-binding GTPase, partial [Parvularculaceae bacterium]|nr:50S ribosome-binding GTPase [Parvularculaceae bacterium]